MLFDVYVTPFLIDASWPLISQLSRRHEYNDLTTRTSFHMFEGDLVGIIGITLVQYAHAVT